MAYFFCKSFTIRPDLRDISSLFNNEVIVIQKIQTGKDIIEFEGLNSDLVFNPNGLVVIQIEGEHQLFTNCGWGRIEKAVLINAPLAIYVDPGYEVINPNKVKVLREKYSIFKM